MMVTIAIRLLIDDEAGVAALLDVVHGVIIRHHPLHRATLSTEQHSVLFLLSTTSKPILGDA